MALIRKPGGVVFYDRFWYYRLVDPGDGTTFLYQHMSSRNMNEGVIVCLQLDNPKRCYSYFPDHGALYRYIITVPDEYRCFYEVIVGNQKPHFDIDIAENKLPSGVDLYEYGDALIDALKERIEAELAVLKVTGYRILEFQSHGISKGVRKYSKHIIVDRIAHSNAMNAKAFYKRVVDGLQIIIDDNGADDTSLDAIQFIDHSVYKNNQQFRLIGSHKFGDERYKEPDGHDMPDPEDLIDSIDYLGNTLVGYTDQCTVIPDLIKARDVSALSTDTLHDLPSDIVEEAMERLQKLYGEVPVPYEIRRVEGQRIELKRTHPSWCPLCKKTWAPPKGIGEPHENDGAVISLFRDTLWFRCWRNDERTANLGPLSGAAQESITKVIEAQPETAGYICMGDLKIKLDQTTNQGAGLVIEEYLSDEEAPSIPKQLASSTELSSRTIPRPRFQFKTEQQRQRELLKEYREDKEEQDTERRLKRLDNRYKRIQERHKKTT
jgi:hypothetical protein